MTTMSAINNANNNSYNGSRTQNTIIIAKQTTMTGANAARKKRSDRQELSTAAASLAPAPSAGQTSEQPASSTSRLVFGLSAKTNRLKHDEYAERRRIASSSSSSSSSGSATELRRQQSPERDGRSWSVSNAESKTMTQQQQAGQEQQVNSRTTGVSCISVKYSGPAVSKPQVASESALAPVKRAVGNKQRGKSPTRASERIAKSSGDRSREASPVKKLSTSSVPPLPSQTKVLVSETSEEPQKMKVKMQFNIPPPPPVQLVNNKTSVVSYAKSRIYDKPVKQVLSNPILIRSIGSVAAYDHREKIPDSILCGFKPPKQVNVSKAREKWEGGEPFAKCKSRQRQLALQAGKKLVLGGSWSMTNVVATQQLQFQANATARRSASSPSLFKEDTSMKVLTRGSVLERVQQFEKDPAGSGNKSPSSSSSSGDSSPPSSEFSGDDELFLGSNLIENEVTLTMRQPDKVQVQSSASVSKPASKLAQYKSKVSSLQNLTDSSSSTSSILSPLSPRSPPATVGFAQQTRRLSLRRKSSTANSQYSMIPKFYHPNGKPNTYEIELQKKNIVACFDKFPDRKALLSGPNYRRHFHSIALACGFSEYFKEPLFLYIRHKMLNSNLLHSLMGGTNSVNGDSLLKRKQSITLTSNGVGTGNQATRNGQALNKLSKAASIDNPTMEKIQSQNYITCDQFLICWKQIISFCFDLPARFIHLLTLGQRAYLLPDDFIPLIQSIIDDHPGLKFLRAAPDFHMRYIQTVIARIYYNINKSWTGKLSLCELRRSNLLAVLQVLSQEEDINQITDYFSYEHFYVIYCKFWNLDQDHDLLISKEDLARHNDAAISSRIIDRIFMGIVSKDIQQTGKMSYTDFVWFLLAEEDKKHPKSIEYWFRLMDLDGDGYISMYEMEYFYYEQIKRLELMNIEALPFVDSACQIFDLVNPREKNKISLQDLKKTKMATIFFDTFINLEKYLEHESREFVSTRDVIQDGVIISDWDRYASEEYENLVTEETSV